MTDCDGRVAAGPGYRDIARYLDRRQLYSFRIAEAAPSGLALAVVIPCFDEPDVAGVLESLGRCDPPGCDVEAIVVVNAPAGAAVPVQTRNRAAVRQVEAAADRCPAWMRAHALRYEDLPPERAGVGLARKIGMDEAAGRLAATQPDAGVIACLDADCRVAPDYLAELVRLFAGDPGCPGASIYFEHPLDDADGERLRSAITEYELHLRYYVQGQRYAGFPFAFHTVGSSIACRVRDYARQGGMNRRQAGEDFYFVQKLVASGGYRALNSTTVYPAPRLSSRVPFGTGRALRDATGRRNGLATYAPETFRDLREFCALVSETPPNRLPAASHALPHALREFLLESGFAERCAEIEANAATPPAFRKRLFRWFNAFRFMKFAQWASQRHYPKTGIAAAANQLAGWLEPGRRADGSARALLEEFRRLDREC